MLEAGDLYPQFAPLVADYPLNSAPTTIATIEPAATTTAPLSAAMSNNADHIASNDSSNSNNTSSSTAVTSATTTLDNPSTVAAVASAATSATTSAAPAVSSVAASASHASSSSQDLSAPHSATIGSPVPQEQTATAVVLNGPSTPVSNAVTPVNAVSAQVASKTEAAEEAKISTNAAVNTAIAATAPAVKTSDLAPITAPAPQALVTTKTATVTTAAVAQTATDIATAANATNATAANTNASDASIATIYGTNTTSITATSAASAASGAMATATAATTATTTVNAEISAAGATGTGNSNSSMVVVLPTSAHVRARSLASLQLRAKNAMRALLQQRKERMLILCASSSIDSINTAVDLVHEVGGSEPTVAYAPTKFELFGNDKEDGLVTASPRGKLNIVIMPCVHLVDHPKWLGMLEACLGQNMSLKLILTGDATDIAQLSMIWPVADNALHTDIVLEFSSLGALNTIAGLISYYAQQQQLEKAQIAAQIRAEWELADSIAAPAMATKAPHAPAAYNCDFSSTSAATVNANDFSNRYGHDTSAAAFSHNPNASTIAHANTLDLYEPKSVLADLADRNSATATAATVTASANNVTVPMAADAVPACSLVSARAKAALDAQAPSTANTALSDTSAAAATAASLSDSGTVATATSSSLGTATTTATTSLSSSGTTANAPLSGSGSGSTATATLSGADAATTAAISGSGHAAQAILSELGLGTATTAALSGSGTAVTSLGSGTATTGTSLNASASTLSGSAAMASSSAIDASTIGGNVGNTGIANIASMASSLDSIDATGDLEITVENIEALANNDPPLLPFTSEALTLLANYCCRLSGDRRYLGLPECNLQTLIFAANSYAHQAHSDLVQRYHVLKALGAHDFRNNFLSESSLREHRDRQLLIATSGAVIGQINGLSVIETLGTSYEFGEPVRITATLRAGGEGDVIDIERKAELAGQIHAKAMMIINGFLTKEFGAEQPLPVSASLVFEQSYSEVDGDSASLTGLCAVISVLAGVPIRQDLAVTGAVDQFGDVQAVGGVNEKIEGFYRVCRLHGFTGTQGVVIPRSCVQQLVLRPAVVKAVADGKFHIFTVDHVTEAVKLLTSVDWGDSNTVGTIRYRIGERLNNIVNNNNSEDSWLETLWQKLKDFFKSSATTDKEHKA